MNKRQILLALCAMILGGVIVGVADFSSGVDLSFAAGDPPITPKPPSFVVTPGRTYDPNETLITPRGSGMVYYVDGMNGNDTNDGRTLATAFKTIGKALDRYSSPLRAGDTLLIRKGLYRERLEIPSSVQGNSTRRTVIGPYGDGEVIIDTSTAVTGWTLVSGQVYVTRPGFTPTAVVVDNQPLFPEFSQGALTEGKWYFNSSTGNLYLWAPGGGSPDTHDVGVIGDDEYQIGIFVNGPSYVTLYGLTERFSNGHGISILGDFIRVEKCKTLFNGKAGISMYGYGSITTTNTEAVKNYAYHNMVRNWPRGRYKWGSWAAGIGSATPNALYQGNIVQKTGGEGILSYIGGGTVFIDNVVFDNWSVNIYVDNQKNSTVQNNWVFCNQPNPADTYNNQDPDPGDGRVLRRLRAEGIMTADENYSLSPPANLENVTIANNVIINCRRGITHYAQATGSGLKNVQILNNTVVVPAALLPWEAAISGISIPYNNGHNSGSVYRNNIVYGSDPGTWLLYAEDIPSAADRFQGLEMGHNLWFHTGRSKPFHWGSSWSSTYDYTHSEWLGLPGTAHGAGDLYADPKLLNPATLLAADKQLQEGSPAVDAGVNGGITKDFAYVPRPQQKGFDIGAYEKPAGSDLPPSQPGSLRIGP